MKHPFHAPDRSYRMSQFKQSFAQSFVSDWNRLHGRVFDSEGWSAFKSKVNHYFLFG